MMTVYQLCKEKIAALETARAEHEAECGCYHDCAICAESCGALGVLRMIKIKLETGELSGIAVTAEEMP